MYFCNFKTACIIIIYFKKMYLNKLQTVAFLVFTTIFYHFYLLSLLSFLWIRFSFVFFLVHIPNACIFLFFSVFILSLDTSSIIFFISFYSFTFIKYISKDNSFFVHFCIHDFNISLLQGRNRI